LAAAHGLEEVAGLLAAARSALRSAPPGLTSEAVLAPTRAGLRRLFRCNPSSPAAAVAYLALDGLTLSGLRGAVAGRAVFEPRT
jgi:hypothetical protein